MEIYQCISAICLWVGFEEDHTGACPECGCDVYSQEDLPGYSWERKSEE